MRRVKGVPVRVCFLRTPCKLRSQLITVGGIRNPMGDAFLIVMTPPDPGPARKAPPKPPSPRGPGCSNSSISIHPMRTKLLIRQRASPFSPPCIQEIAHGSGGLQMSGGRSLYSMRPLKRIVHIHNNALPSGGQAAHCL